MGLDSYVYRIRRAKPLENRTYTPDELREFDLDYFLKDEPDEELVKQLMPYCQEVQVRSSWVDVRKICEEYGLSNDSYVCMQRGNGDIGITDPAKKENSYTAISAKEIEAKFLLERTLPYCVYRSEEVAYWRKNYSVQDFFYENLDHVENTGFYLLDADVLTDFNLAFGDSLGGLPVAAPTDEQALFYHEWY